MKVLMKGMEGKEAVSVESIVGGSSATFSDLVHCSSYPLQTVFDNFYEGGEKGSLGFMELLGIQDITSSSVLDILQQQVPSALIQQPPATNNSNPGVVITKMESPHEVMNQPATPNSSSISSASSEALNDEAPVKALDNEEEHKKNKKELKPKKTIQKRQREPRFAFMTKSEVDHLEDGYRWRKYGQKAVKNSPFPRSYYRCTNSSCNVKKRVERSFSDPSIVVTTYEGQHTHPSPVIPRPGFVGSASETAFPTPMQRSLSLYQQPQPFANHFSPSGFGCNPNANSSLLLDRRFCTTSGGAAALLQDHGLLQDIIPSHMLKE